MNTHPSVWLFKQEVSRKPSNLVRGTKGGTGKAIDDFRLKTSAGKHLTISELGTWQQLTKGKVYLGLVSFLSPNIWSLKP